MLKSLKKSVIVFYGSSVRNVSDIENLKNDILKQTGKYIGFNTLRRLYGYLPHTKPNSNTLNTLSNYIGYSSYIEYQRKFKLDREWNDWDYINNIVLEKNISEKNINWLYSKRKSGQYYYLLSYLISVLIHKKDHSNLKLIFSKDDLFNMERSNLAKVSTSLSKNFKSLTKNDLKWFSFLLTYKSFRDLMLYSYVDLDTISSYYGYLLRESLNIIKHEDEILFTNLILELELYLKLKNLKLNPDSLIIPSNCHPILLGRYYSILFLKNINSKDEIFNLIIEESKKQESIIEFFQEIIPVLIIQKELVRIEIIFDLYYDELLDYDYWDHIHIERYNLVALMLIHLKNNNLKLVENLFRFFNEESNFHVNDNYQKILFFIAKYQYLKELKESTSQTKQQYLKIVKETGFRIFDEKYLLNYFN